MKSSHLKITLADAILAKEPIVIKSAPGFGKTDIVKQAAADANADLVILHPVVSDPTDFKGLPAIVDQHAEFLEFGDLRKLMYATKLTVCFLDDLGQAPASVQAAVMQLLLAREINGKKISEHVTFVAATNRREDRAGVTGLLEPVKSRFTGGIIELTFDLEDWIQWALSAGMPISLIAFNKYRPNLMTSWKATPDLINGPCPRTVAALGRKINRNLPEELKFEVYSGIVGEGYASEYLAFEKIMTKLPSIDRIVMTPDTVDVPNEPSVLYAICGALARKATENTMPNIMKYINRIPAEFSVLFIKQAIDNDPNVVNTRAYIEWESKHSDFRM